MPHLQRLHKPPLFTPVQMVNLWQKPTPIFEVLKLQLRVEEQLIGFYREDTGEKLLIPSELAQALEQERQRTEKLATKLRELGVDPEQI